MINYDGINRLAKERGKRVADPAGRSIPVAAARKVSNLRRIAKQGAR